MTEWRADEAALRAVLANTEDCSPPVSTDRLRQLGYLLPGGDEADARTRADARDACLLRVVPDQESMGEAS